MSKFSLGPESFSYFTDVAVQWGDMDAQGHVNNSRYLTYFETARCEFFRQFHLFAQGGDAGPVVAQAEIHYRSQLSYPSIIRVFIRATAIRDSSFKVEYAIYENEPHRLIADGSTLIIWVDFRTGRRCAFPVEWLEPLKSLNHC